MKSPDKEKAISLERLLVLAYRREQESDVVIGDGWQNGVMKHIRRSGPLTIRSAASSLLSDNRLVWRFAAAATLVSVILLISYVVVSRGFVPHSDLVTNFIDDPDRLILLQP